MTTDDLQHRYRRLREALEDAYAATPWNPQRIDGITAQMLPLERALGARSAGSITTSQLGPVPPSPLPT